MSIPAPILQYTLSDATIKGLLPAGYTPLTYIESTGTQYINTEIIPANKIISTEAKFQLTSEGTAAPTLIGSGVTDGTDNCRLFGIYQSKWRIKLSGTNWQSSNNIDTHIHIIRINFSNGSFLDNNKILNNQVTISLTNNKPLYIFDDNNGGGTEFCGKVYYLTLYNNNNLIGDYRPARRDSDGVLGMYDLVSRTFKTNSGSGTFIAGPPLAIGKGGGKSLPEEYQQVEWLQSTGTQYINAGLATTATQKFKVKWSDWTNSESMAALFGSTGQWGNTFLRYNGVSFLTTTSPSYKATSVTGTCWGEIELYSNGTAPVGTINGSISMTSYSNTDGVGNNLTIFRGGANNKYAVAKLMYLQVYDGSTLQRYFFPCYRKSDMKPGMYDVVNGVFYTNAGSGEFILGPTVNTGYTWEPNANINYALIPSIYRQVEYLESTGTQYINTNYAYNSTNNTYKVQCKFQMTTAIYAYQAVYGAYTDENSNAFRLLRANNNTSLLITTNGKAGGNNNNQNIGSIFDLCTIDHSYDSYTISNLTTENSWTNSSPSHGNGNDTTSTFCLFAQASGSCLSAVRIYNFKLYDNNKLERYMIPCYRKSDSKPGMYDVVHNVFYTNNGSGEFTLGPVVCGGGLYSNLSGVYDSIKGWVGDFNNGNASTITTDYISIPTNSWTLSAWIYPEAIPSGHMWPVSINTSTAADFLATLCFYNGSFGVRTGSTTYAESTVRTLNQWYFVVGTCDGTTLKLYVNGSNVNNWTSITAPVAATKLTIGMRGGSAGVFDGRISNVQIFNTALTAAQVKELYGK